MLRTISNKENLKKDVKLKQKTHHILSKLGTKDETFDDVINKLIKEYLKSHKIDIKKLLILFSLFPLFSFFLFEVSANPSLSVAPSSLNANVIANVPSNFPLTFMNNGNETITSITMSPVSYISFSQIPSLNIGQSIISNITINTNSVLNQQFQLRFSFIFLANTTLTPKTININISDSEINPNSVQINVGDTIIFKNIGTIDHGLIADDGSFSYTLTSGSTQSVLFNAIKTMTYHTTPIQYVGNIDILNNQVQVSTTNPAYDKFVTLNLNSQLQSSTITMDLDKSSFTIPFNSSEESFLKLTNIGSSTAVNLILNSDWVGEFSKNNFNLAPNEATFVTFKVRPAIAFTNQTNQTYTKTITLSGGNVNVTSRSLSIFVPYTNLGETFQGTFGSINELIAKLLDFCNSNPFSPSCINGTSGVQYVYLYPNFTFDLTEEEVRNLIAHIPSDFDRSRSSLEGIYTAFLNDNNQTLTSLLNDINTNNVKNDERDKKINTLMALLITLLVLIFMGITVVFGDKLNKYLKHKGHVEHGDKS